MRVSSFLAMGFVLMGSLCTTTVGADIEPVAWWSFDVVENRTVLEPAGDMRDTVLGLYWLDQGASGKSISFDGRTTHIVRKSSDVPDLSGGLTVEAWVAPQVYSWHESAIVDWDQDNKAGFTFGVDRYGRVYFHVAVGGKWHRLLSQQSIPLLHWTHVTATYDKTHGTVIYINGQRSASSAVTGEMTIPRDHDLWLGKSHTKMSPWGTERSLSRKLSFTEMHWEGLIDEVKIYDQVLSADDVNHAYNAVKPPVAQPLQWQRMPTGPQDINSFGGRYHRFHFHPAWDLNWQGPEKPGVLVSFDDPFRLTFWRGAAYSPLWFSENGIGMSHEFMERGGKGTAELMNDKTARYSSAEIIENTDARVVVYWRNAPARVDYALPYVRDDTGWGDWSEEYYTVYPDGVACRRVVMWTANQEDWYEWSQSLPILNPGQRPEEIFEDSRFVTLADMTGQTRTFTWPPVSVPPVRSMAGANIQVIHFKSTYKPFLIMTGDKPLRTPGIWLTPYRPRHDIKPGEEGPVPSAMAMPTISKYWWWNHWPVAQLPNDGRIATAADRVAHSWTSTQDAKPFETTEYGGTQVQLNGMTDKPAGELVTLARSWLQPAELTLTSEQFSYEKYDQLERAYVLSSDGDGSALRFTLAASEQSPVLNPCFVIKNWGEHGAVLRVDDEPVARGKAFRYGLRDVSAAFAMAQRHHQVRQERIGADLPLPDSRTRGKDLIVYIQMQVTEPVLVSLARGELTGRE